MKGELIQMTAESVHDWSNYQIKVFVSDLVLAHGTHMHIACLWETFLRRSHIYNTLIEYQLPWDITCAIMEWTEKYIYFWLLGPVQK